eukprot:TRINITY_DN11614_c0_g1_i1.p1 TRINITY_DN11614_c0_g1~~TRINITY_DN11614_c0_g1_i1.p1  ORF type:complete len:119 (-),score=16.34 TRINITY_DN11614_c0_g1_i1:111-467(-)
MHISANNKSFPLFDQFISLLGDLTTSPNNTVPMYMTGLGAFLKNLSTNVEDDYWYFPGSLTTPPCSEGVSWYLMQKIGDISISQFGAFNALMKNNSRPVQRNITYVSAYHPVSTYNSM